MRVGLDYRPALLQRTGIGRYAMELTRAIGRLDGGPTLALFGESFAAVAVPEALRSFDPKRARLYRRRIPGRALPFLAGLGVGAGQLLGGVDLFHYTDFVYPPLRDTPFVATIHDASFAADDAYHGPRESSTLRARAASIVDGARAILVPSAFAGGECVIRLGANPSRVFVTPLGVDHFRPAAPSAPRPGGPYLLTVGTIEPRKNHLRALEAFERVRSAGLPHRWVVVGKRGWLTRPFFDRLAASPVRDAVSLRGVVDDGELARLYADADLLLYPSLHEGFGLPPLEAMAAGTPVVASATTALGEICAGGAALVDPSDAAGIADAVLAVVRDAELRATLVARGRATAARFTWASTASGTLAAYARALRADGASAPPVRAPNAAPR